MRPYITRGHGPPDDPTMEHVDKLVQFFVGMVLWMLISSILLLSTGSFSLGVFFLFTFVGLLIMVESTKVVDSTPLWRIYLKWVVRALSVVFVLLVLVLNT